MGEIINLWESLMKADGRVELAEERYSAISG